MTTCESCINEDDDDENDDSETSPYKKMNLCYEVRGWSGNNYHYEWSYYYETGNGEEGNKNNDTTGPFCFDFSEVLMDTVDASMRTDPNQCENCTAYLSIEIFIEETETWEMCASESTGTSNWINAICVAEEHG